MLPVNRASVLIAAALAVASPFVAGAMARADGAVGAPGAGRVLLDWPNLLIEQLPGRIGGVLMMSGLVPLLLYFGAYLLACHGVRLLWRRARRAQHVAP
ncbi:MAG: hypothetical protein JF586_21225 [Burkholderiales bacterium]|jgi:hypothetical protein|nr:hypothetical protein [Burkholderiales bacterium]